jgi:hypothetical protein
MPSESAPADDPVDLSRSSLIVLPWLDPVLEEVGFDPRAPYVERYWLPALGPSTVLLARLLAEAFDADPEGFELDLAVAATRLGLGGNAKGRLSPFARAFQRLTAFGWAEVNPYGLSVRRFVPPLAPRQVMRLHPALVADHERWQAMASAPAESARARELARTLSEVLGDPALVRRDLHRLGVPPRLARWALERGDDGTSRAA